MRPYMTYLPYSSALPLTVEHMSDDMVSFRCHLDTRAASFVEALSA